MLLDHPAVLGSQQRVVVTTLLLTLIVGATLVAGGILVRKVFPG